LISTGLLVTLALGVLCASLALLTARLGFPLVADVLAVGAGLLGLAAFLTAALSTVRHARRLASSGERR
jgi:hypothetical protein